MKMFYYTNKNILTQYFFFLERAKKIHHFIFHKNRKFKNEKHTNIKNQNTIPTAVINHFK